MNESSREAFVSQYLAFRLNRQNHYLDFLEMELDHSTTEAEASVVLSLLKKTRNRINQLEHQWLTTQKH